MVRCSSWLLVALGLVGSAEAFAQTSGADAAPAAHDGTDAGVTQTLFLVVRGDSLDSNRLREALTRDLGRAVMLVAQASDAEGDRVTVTYRRDSGELAVSFDAGAHTMTRVIKAEGDSVKVADDAALLAVSLVQNAEPKQAPKVATEAPNQSHAALTTANEGAVAAGGAPRQKPLLAVASFVFPLATNYRAPYAKTNFEFNLLHGRIGELEGLQLGSVSIVAGRRGEASGDARGAQISMLASVTTGSVHGLQVAPINVAGGGYRGLQLGAVNIAAKESRGLQIGAVNVATGTVTGAQVGFFNYAKDIRGVPIGIVSVTETGGVHLMAWGSTASYGNVGVQFATKYTYSTLFGSVHHAYDRWMLGTGAALGVRVPFAQRFHFEADLMFSYLRAVQGNASPLGDFHHKLYQPRVRASVRFSLARHLSVFAGAGFMVQVHEHAGGLPVEVQVRPEGFAGIAL